MDRILEPKIFIVKFDSKSLQKRLNMHIKQRRWQVVTLANPIPSSKKIQGEAVKHQVNRGTGMKNLI